MEKRFSGRSLLAFALGALLIGACVFARAMERDLNHDEHQFIAPGVLLARHGLLPYRDYPLFHLPNLVIVYGTLNAVCSSPIFGGKIVSIVSTWLLAISVFLCSAGIFGKARVGWRIAAGFGGVSLLFFDPVFTYASGKLWNHEFPTAFAVLCLLTFLRRDKNVNLLILSGLCLGIGIGSRLTFAPLLLPFLVFLLLERRPISERLRLVCHFSIGVAVGLLPTLATFCLDPQAFLFGNLEFPRLRLLDPENTRIQKTMTIRAKTRYFLKEIVVPSWPLFLAFGAFAAKPAFRWFKARQEDGYSAALCVSTVPFLVLGCFLPSRYQYQHFFALIPFLVLSVVFGLRAWPAPSIGFARKAFGLLVVASIATSLWTTLRKSGPQGYAWIANSMTPGKWFPNRARAISVELRDYVVGGKVLTLAPAWPLEAGLSIYPEFATGPFAWRSARFVSPERRKRFKLVAPADLEGFLEGEPPAAILTGVEDADLEEPLIRYASAHAYQAVALQKRRTLWIPDGRASGRLQ